MLLEYAANENVKWKIGSFDGKSACFASFISSCERLNCEREPENLNG